MVLRLFDRVMELGEAGSPPLRGVIITSAETEDEEAVRFTPPGLGAASSVLRVCCSDRVVKGPKIPSIVLPDGPFGE